MTREDIDKAAIDNIEFQGNLDLGTIIENACRESFVSGANWRINSAWHSTSEEPILWDLIIRKDNNGEYELGFELKPDTVSWAYVKDLTPNTEECV